MPDQFAGQVMKCPLCSNTFTTPSLPPAPGPAYVAPPMPARRCRTHCGDAAAAAGPT